MSERVVLVTGGARGIGRAIAQAFLDAGAEVAICARHEPETLPASADGARTALFVAADVRDPEAADVVVGATTARFGGLHVLVNNAGGSPSADSATASARFSTAVVTLNLIAPLVFAQRVNAVMQDQADGGTIINVASVSGLRGSPGFAAYAAAKAGLLNLTRTLAIDFAPKVTVNAVAAGLVRTEQSTLHYGDDAGVAAVGATVPLGRMAEVEEIADVCRFLASPLARYVDGAQITVDGGGEWPAYLSAATPSTRAFTDPNNWGP